jgi:hypothetical protein
MSELKKFEFRVGGRSVELEVGKCAVALFRDKREVDYISVDLGEENALRIFNNVEFTRWVGGYAIGLDENGHIDRSTVLMEQEDGSNVTFRELTGWNPSVIEKEAPFDWEEEMWLEVNLRDLAEAPPEDWT